MRTSSKSSASCATSAIPPRWSKGGTFRKGVTALPGGFGPASPLVRSLHSRWGQLQSIEGGDGSLVQEVIPRAGCAAGESKVSAPSHQPRQGQGGSNGSVLHT